MERANPPKVEKAEKMKEKLNHQWKRRDKTMMSLTIRCPQKMRSQRVETRNHPRRMEMERRRKRERVAKAR